jgi:hypothetical protein
MGRFLVFLCSLTVVGCSSAGSVSVEPDAKAGAPDADASAAEADANADPNTRDSSGPTPSAVYAVHGGAADLPPFRLCLSDDAKPVPSDPTHPIPLTNFPGVGVGGMADLGDLSGNYSVRLFPAQTIQDSSSDHDAICKTLVSDKLIPYEQLDTVDLQSGVQLLVVVGEKSSRKVFRVAADTGTYSGGGTIHLQMGHFSASLKTSPIVANFGTKGATTMPLGSVSFSTLAPAAVEVTFASNPLPKDYDTYGVDVSGTFYSLSDIQHATDPTTTPNNFFNGRLNAYALVLVDDANTGHHIVAVPLKP